MLWTISAGQFLDALTLATICGFIAGLVVVPVRGRPALRWLWHLIFYQVGVLTGWSRWQSKAASGAPVAPDEPDLPGVLARVSFPDGPPFRDQGRICLIHDTGEARWGATARLTHSGVGMLSDASASGWPPGWAPCWARSGTARGSTGFPCWCARCPTTAPSTTRGAWATKCPTRPGWPGRPHRNWTR